MNQHTALFQRAKDKWVCFQDPVDVLQAADLSDVTSVLSNIEDALSQGLYAAGFLSYEAAPAFDPALSVTGGSDLPLAQFYLYDSVEVLGELPAPESSFSLQDWTPSISEDDYHSALRKIRDYIEAGDTYQVNYTLRMLSQFTGDPYALFHSLWQSQRSRNCAYFHTGKHAICSASPELFLWVDGEKIKSCPMKGTARRGLDYDDDCQKLAALQRSEKDQAENVMIVDMIRNDMGRVAKPGTVEVTSSFDVERYPTVFQMTSTVEAQTDAKLTEIIKEMFPCASITGAPKVRTMELIKELETTSRGLYTGSIGYMMPEGLPGEDSGRKMLLNVAIRTVVIDQESGEAEYGVGGGIVWDSEAGGEYQECLDKARVLTADVPDFELLETIAWKPELGYVLLQRHLDRLSRSAEYFDIDLDVEVVRVLLEDKAQGFDVSQRVRLLVTHSGSVTIENLPLPEQGDNVFKLGVASDPVDSSDPFLYHKTTNRGVYEKARASCVDVDDVILLNERGEITETTIANIVIEKDGKMITPAVSSGLLAGVFRAELLANGEIQEVVVTLHDLKSATRLFVVNSVRGWVPATVNHGV